MKRFIGMAMAIAMTTVFSFQSMCVTAAETNFNYGEALQKGIMFYEFQRAGKLPTDKRDNWRADAAMDDGKDVGLDLTGGWFDAGDHVKFNLPMSYTATMLAWSVTENKNAYVKSGQLKYIMEEIKWANDYFIKCHPSPNVYYYQVGDGNADHKWWGPAEAMQMARPSHKVDESAPGSTVVAETAASLASAAFVFKDSDPTYAATCIKHAKELYNFAETTKSDKGYTQAATFYDSWSGFYDELSWAGVWLYMATGDQTYLDKAELYVADWGREQQTDIISYKWGHCWDDVKYGAEILLAKLTDKDLYKESTERHLDYWTTGYGTNRVTYTKGGLAFLQNWGSLRHATTEAFIATVYANYSGCTSSKVSIYKDFAKQQVDYALGSTGRSYVVGFGVNPPQRPHHRTAHSSWWDSQKEPNYHRHTLYGALVGGPKSSSDDSYVDDIGDYYCNEVACDYNAGFVGALAQLYDVYGGTPIANFNAIEEKTNDEYFVEAKVNSIGPAHFEIKAYMINKSGWPARVADKLSFKYFMDLSEVVEAGVDPASLVSTTNYNQGATVSEVLPWDKANNIYYVNVDFTGTKIFPGGQSDYRKEVQFRVSAPADTKFLDVTNDFSYQDIPVSQDDIPVKTLSIPVYDDGVKIFGNEPSGGTVVTPTVSITPTGSITYVYGDANGDKKVDSADYTLLRSLLLGKVSTLANPDWKTAMDVKKDGKIDSADYTILRKYLLKIIESIPVV